MKILLVHNFYRYRGGEDAYFLSLVDILKKNGHQLFLYTKDSRDIGTSFWKKVRIAINLFSGNESKSEIYHILKKHKPDIIHCNNLIPLITPFIYKEAKRQNIPIVQTIHNYRMICPGGYLHKNNGEKCIHNLKKFSIFKILQNCYQNSYISSTILSLASNWYRIIDIYKDVDLFLFPTNFTLKLYKNRTQLPSNKMRFLPYFVNINNITTNRNQKKYFLYVGLFSEIKGIIKLLNIFANLPNIDLIVIGGGSLNKFVDQFKKYENIHLKGLLPNNEVKRYMKNAIATIIPSQWYEIGPMVMYESMAAGTPVIVPRIGVFKDIIEEGKTGFFFKFNRSDELRKKILYVFENRNNLRGVQRTEKETFRKNYSPKIHYSKLISYYEYLLSDKKLPILISP